MPNTKYPIPCPMTGRMAYEGTASQLQEYYNIVGQPPPNGQAAFSGASDAYSRGPVSPPPDLKIL